MAVKNIKASDLVPASVLLDIAKRVRKEAARIAKQKHAPLTSERSGAKGKYDPRLIHISTPRVTQNQTSVDLSLTEVAMAFEYGSNPHPINARNKPLLVFEGTNQWAGQIISIESVKHPGFKKRPFLKPAKENTRKQNLEDIRKTSLANTRLIVSAMKRVV
jgi:hypothetical protein